MQGDFVEKWEILSCYLNALILMEHLFFSLSKYLKSVLHIIGAVLPAVHHPKFGV